MKLPRPLHHAGRPSPEAGFSLPLTTIGIALAASVAGLALGIPLGWIAAGLFVGVGGLWIHDRLVFRSLQPGSGGIPASEPRHPPAPLVDPDRLCPRCAEPLFVTQRGRTTPDEIRAFARRSVWRTNPEALAGWMPLGMFCPNGCVSALATPAPPFGDRTSDREEVGPS